MNAFNWTSIVFLQISAKPKCFWRKPIVHLGLRETRIYCFERKSKLQKYKILLAKVAYNSELLFSIFIRDNGILMINNHLVTLSH
jgi:hypothetical protein